MDCELCPKQGAPEPGPGRWWCDDCKAFLCDFCRAGPHSAAAFAGHSVHAAEGEEEVEDITEEEALRWLEAHEDDPQRHCAQIFRPDVPDTFWGGARWLTRATAEALRGCGFVVVDGFISQELAAAIRAKAEGFAARGDLLRPAAATSAGDSRRAGYVRGDLHAFLHPSEPLCCEAPFSDLLAQLALLQQELAQVVELRAGGLHEEELQLAVYPGGGTGYERHRDAMPDDGHSLLEDGTPVLQRRVTAIVYTSSDWAEADGGQLKIWLTPAQLLACQDNPAVQLGGVEGDEVVVAPLAGRLLLFLSGAVDHCVMPCRRMRTAVTAWLH